MPDSLTDEERKLLVNVLTVEIEGSKFPLSPRIVALKAIRAKLRGKARRRRPHRSLSRSRASPEPRLRLTPLSYGANIVTAALAVWSSDAISPRRQDRMAMKTPREISDAIGEVLAAGPKTLAEIESGHLFDNMEVALYLQRAIKAGKITSSNGRYRWR